MTQPHKLRPSAELDHWCWQLQLLDDLNGFVQEHGPSSTDPLPTVNWTLGIARQASAELPLSNPDPLATLDAFARALGTTIRAQRSPGKVVYRVHGRIGACEGSSQQPRTDIVVRATSFLDFAGVGLEDVS
jgi:hypothetical protein